MSKHQATKYSIKKEKNYSLVSNQIANDKYMVLITANEISANVQMKLRFALEKEGHQMHKTVNKITVKHLNNTDLLPVLKHQLFSIFTNNISSVSKICKQFTGIKILNIIANSQVLSSDAASFAIYNQTDQMMRLFSMLNNNLNNAFVNLFDAMKTIA